MHTIQTMGVTMCKFMPVTKKEKLPTVFDFFESRQGTALTLAKS